MPYVSQDRRTGLREPIDAWANDTRALYCQSTDPDDTNGFFEKSVLYILTLGVTPLISDETVREELQAEYRDETGDKQYPITTAVDELKARKERGESIGGDVNFCICRYLVGVTEIHIAPRYESKIQWIQERLEGVRTRLTAGESMFYGAFANAPPKAWRLGLLYCVQAELYRRYAAPFEDIKCLENGDIMG